MKLWSCAAPQPQRQRQPIDKSSMQPTMARIKEIVSRRYKISIIDMESNRRTKDAVWARQVAAFLCATMTHHGLLAIGRQFGGRDHTTILHSRRKIDQLAAIDERLNNELEILKAIIVGRLSDDYALE